MILRSPYRSGAVAVQPVVGHSPYRRDARLARVEAVLLLADEPLNTRKISQLANLADGTEARTLIRRLNSFYDRQGTAFRAEETAGGYQLLTRRKFAGWLRRLVRTHVEARLSAPALETLAVVAYRQPVTRAEIEAIRGVQCDEMLRQLMERELVRIAGRSEELGRPYLYGTTKRFLRFFGLRHLDELPRAAEMRSGASDRPTKSGPQYDDDPTNTDPQDNVLDSQEESEVKIAVDTELAREEALKRRRLAWADEVRAEDDDDEDEEEEDEDDDLDDDEDDEDDDEDEDEDDEDFDDDDFDDDWEEVDDEDEDDDEDDEDWDDDDEDDDDEEGDDDFDDEE